MESCADSSEESSSEESESEDDESMDESIDSREVGLMHLDERICPPGCEKNFYETAFAMREKRYALEARIREVQKKIEGVKKELESDVRKSKQIAKELLLDSEKLQEFMVFN